MFIRKKYTTHRNIIIANSGTRSEFFRENGVYKLVVRSGLVAVPPCVKIWTLIVIVQLKLISGRNGVGDVMV